MKKIKSYILLICGVLFSFSIQATTINVWEQMEPKALEEFKKIVKDFNDNNPDIRVVLKHYGTEDLRTNFQTAALARSAPDIVYGPDDMVGLFVTANIIAPLDRYFDTKFLNQFDKQALDSTGYKGKNYGLPDMHGNHIALVYNKKLVKNAPSNFNSFLSEAKKHQVKGKSRKDNTYGLVFNIKEPFWFIGFYNGFGGRVFDKAGNPSLNNAAMVSALEFVRDIRGKHELGLEGMDYDISHQLFSQGKAAFILQGNWAWGEYQAQKMDFGVSFMPLPNGKKALFYSSTKTFLFSNAKQSLEKKQAINKFMQYVFSKDTYKPYALAQGIIPTTKELKADKDIQNNFLVKSGQEALKNTIAMPNVPELRAVWDAIRPSLEAVLEGDLEPKEAAEKMQEDAQKYIKTILN